MTMKLSAIAAFSMTLCLASCTADEALVSNEENVIVPFSITLPADLQTRADGDEVAKTTFGDGSQTTINSIGYDVYKVTGDEGNYTRTWLYNSSKSETVTDINNTILIEIPMVKEFKYQVVFYAKNSANSKVNFSKGVLTVSYDGVAPNDASADVFVGRSKVITVANTATTEFHRIALKRPFAQLNWGTTAIDEITLMGAEQTESNSEEGEESETTTTEKKSLIDTMTASVTISSGLYTQYDILNDEVVSTSSVSNPVTFTAVNCNALPEVNFPVDGYKLVAMNYILVGKGEGTEAGTINCSIKFDWTDNGVGQNRTTTVNSAPCMANYRTNIYGDLIMTPEKFRCTINRAFGNDETENGDNNITGDNLNFTSGIEGDNSSSENTEENNEGNGEGTGDDN